MSVTLLIIIFTSAISFLCFNNRHLFDQLKHSPVDEKHQGQYYRLITSGFVHADLTHLLVNMFVLYQFGGTIEKYFVLNFGMEKGLTMYLISYILIIILGDLPTYLKYQDTRGFASVGASGAISGILFFYIMMHPWSMLGLYMIIPVPAILFGVLYLWYSSWASNKQNDNIDHDGHFYGALAGIAIAIATRPDIVSEFLYKLQADFPF